MYPARRPHLELKQKINLSQLISFKMINFYSPDIPFDAEFNDTISISL